MKKPYDARISCYEVMAEVQAVTAEVLPGAPVFLVGGGPAAAIRHKSTNFDHDGRRLIATADSAESTIRDNGSKRDLDLLAMRVLEGDEGARAEKAILEAIGERMVVSVFGLDRREQPTITRNIKRSVLDWTSRRTIDERGVHRYEIYPLEQELTEPDLVYEEWLMQLPSGGEISVMSPDTTVYNYDVRSVTPRTKDQEKLKRMKDRIHDEPQFVERLVGPLKPVIDLAEGIVKLGKGKLETDSPLLAPGATFFARGAFRARAELYATGQRSEAITKLVGHNETAQKLLKATTGRK
jgi:hypothetical protein